MHSFFVDSLVSEGERQLLSARESDHLFKTLRARLGDEVELLDGNGGRARAVVGEGKSLLVESLQCETEPERKLRLYCAPPRKAKFDVLLKQAAELGVWEIQLVAFERNIAKPEGSDRWETLLQEGCKQSKNPFLPRVLPTIGKESMLECLRQRGETAYFGAIRSENRGGSGKGDLAWIVGPEGGFTPAEENWMRENGILPLNLGPWVLRLETAAVCGLAVLRQWMDV